MEKRNLIKMMTEKVLSLVVEELDKADTQILIKQRIVVPLITMIYNELYPYIVALACIIVVMLVLSLLTFIGFIVYYLKTL
jgi:hypothetical protein